MSPNTRVDRILAEGAAAGICFFIVVVALLPLAQLGAYDMRRQAISEMAIGNGGWLLNVAFCIMGGGFACLAFLLRRSTGTARVAPILLGIVAGLDIVSAAFHAVRYDAPMTAESTVHMIAGILSFVLTIVAMFSMVRPFRRNPAWKHFAWPTLAWAFVSTACFFFLGPGLLGQAHFGLGQRGMAFSFLSWMLTTTVIAYLIAGATERRHPMVGKPVHDLPLVAGQPR